MILNNWLDPCVGCSFFGLFLVALHPLPTSFLTLSYFRSVGHSCSTVRIYLWVSSCILPHLVHTYKHLWMHIFFPPFQELWQTDQPTERPMDMRDHRRVKWLCLFQFSVFYWWTVVCCLRREPLNGQNIMIKWPLNVSQQLWKLSVCSVQGLVIFGVGVCVCVCVCAKHGFNFLPNYSWYEMARNTIDVFVFLIVYLLCVLKNLYFWLCMCVRVVV